MSLSKTVEIATLELGVCEEPVNRVKYNTAYYGREVSGKEYKWCVVFLWWVFQQAGERMAFFGGGKTASCGMLLRWYKEQGLTVPVQQAQPGDIAIYNFSGTIEPEHCGLITEVKMAITTIASVKSIEGNTTTSNGSESNGGCVAEKTRFTKNIVAVCRPQYKADDPQPVDDVTGHWAKGSIEWAMEKGLIKGYPDGSFKPNSPLTRAEACVILERFYELLWKNDMR